MNEDPLDREPISEMLKAWSDGDDGVADKFMPLVYDELRRQARRYLRRERPNHTLQTSALVHEAYLRLVAQEHIDWENRAHFFGLAAQMMRRILVNYAVKRHRNKRGGAGEDLSLIEAATAGKEKSINVIELDQALMRLQELDEQQAKIVELRYFSGLSIQETAHFLKISPATVKREWAMAKAWLSSQLGDGSR